MAEYIDREKVREEACKGCTHRVGSDGCGWPEPCEKLLAAFIAAEPSDVAPVVHSRWVQVNSTQEHFCIECGAEFNLYAYCKDMYNYCPCCSALMDGHATQDQRMG